VAQTYDQKRELLASLWEALWPALQPAQRERLLALPDPCHNHLQDRMRKEDRAQRLKDGCRRITSLDSELFLEGLRLYPHALARAAEAVGPLPKKLWNSLRQRLCEHRLWRVGEFLEGEEPAERFWRAVEVLEHHRQLPQPILDFLEAGRAPADAPLEEFMASLARFLVRAKLEKMRFGSYSAVKGFSTADDTH
jgi:hypothetical protein